VSVPGEIPGLGSSTQKIRANPSFDPMKAGIGPEEYFVLSRIDGALTLREVLLMTGLPIDRAIEVVKKLRGLGAILLPGETPMSAPRPSASGSGTQRAVTNAGADRARGTTGRAPTASGSRPPTGRLTGRQLQLDPEPEVADDTLDLDKNLESPSSDELAALTETNDLSDDDRRLILAMARRLGWGDAWSLFGLPPGADKRRVKRSYFKLSKEFHPDRYYGRQLGSFRDRLDRIFEALSRGYADLTDPKAKDAAQPRRKTGETQSPLEYAAELYARACETEVHGDPLEAMKQFAAAIRIDPQVKYLRRAARCALTAGQPRTAEEYANKATNLDPQDLSTSRLLAAAFRAQNKLDAAEEVLVMALAMPSKNDALVMELRRDLAEIRKVMGGIP
jgi:tetratricopeptide (TPR) repeat protein